MARSKTPSFIFEQKLLTSRQDERVLDLRFRCVWHIKLQLVKHARRQISKYLDDPYRKTLVSERSCLLGKNGRLSVKRRTEISHALNDIRLSYGLSQYQFKLWVKPLQHRYKKHIDSRTAQCISDDIWNAADKYLFGNGEKLHFPKSDDILSVESNDNLTGIRFKKGHILWCGLDIQMQRASHSSSERAYEEEALSHRVRYCRLIRKQFSGRWHYFIQLVMEGLPPKKHSIGTGRVGIDPGTLSAAVVSEGKCILTALNDGVSDYSREISRLNRALDRSRRANNLNNYNRDGTVKKGRKTWVYSKSYRILQRKRHSLERKQAASLKCHHEALADEILSLGDDIYTEQMLYSGLQRRAKETTKNCKGRYNKKSRFGKSLKNGAPAMLLSVIDRKLYYEGRELHKVNTRTFRASQYNHVTDEYIRKRLSRRHNIIDGRWIQRDLYSAFLLMNSNAALDHADRELCQKTYEMFLVNHDHCIADLTDGKHKLLSSFGICRAA